MKFVTAHRSNVRAQVSFDRPVLSPCLRKLDEGSPDYRSALAIIEGGAKRLKETPRCDMDGFVPAEVDRKRLEKYIRRQEVESANRRAIREGRKAYDRDFLR